MDKTCPVVLRYGTTAQEMLVFRHPLAGIQLVKGTVEPGETASAGALRELAEETGIEAAYVRWTLGQSSQIASGQTWYFYECACDTLPDSWTHLCADDGGHLFSFFWWSLTAQPHENWHPVFQRALAHIRQSLQNGE